MVYSVIRNLLFQTDPEWIHEKIIRTWEKNAQNATFNHIVDLLFKFNDPRLAIQVGKLSFPNPIGLAAGFDKDAKAISLFEKIGFGSVEIGTVTPKPQPGNEKPRLFRLKQQQGLINRMGFNNDGVEIVTERLRNRSVAIPIGVNLGKNKDTPIDNAIDDYVTGMKTAWEVADYFTINISSPNTQNLRDLQSEDYLYPFIEKLRKAADQLSEKYKKSKQIWLKIAPDLSDAELLTVVEISTKFAIDALVLTNTTITRSTSSDPLMKESGGLSGRPLFRRSNEVLKKVADLTQNQIPLIGVGGIFSTSDLLEKLRLGATMVQVYSGFVFEGPGLIKKMKKELSQKMSNMGVNQVRDLVI